MTVIRRGFLCIYVGGPQVLHLNGRASHKCSMHARLMLQECAFSHGFVDIPPDASLLCIRLISSPMLSSCFYWRELPPRCQGKFLCSSCVSLVHLWSGASVLASSFLQWALHTRPLLGVWSQTCVWHAQPNVAVMPWWVCLCTRCIGPSQYFDIRYCLASGSLGFDAGAVAEFWWVSLCAFCRGEKCGQDGCIVNLNFGCPLDIIPSSLTLIWLLVRRKKKKVFGSIFPRLILNF